MDTHAWDASQRYQITLKKLRPVQILDPINRPDPPPTSDRPLEWSVDKDDDVVSYLERDP